ncbi:MAG TPA: class I SAM-dependent methyltransferase [Dehalococcoidia bacterium]|nr:class I SAM-dependent methyltransferase [Dehalococcoidia bacterium]
MTQQHTTGPGGVMMEVPGHHWQEQDRVDEYVARTTTVQAEDRAKLFNLMCDLFPFEKDAAIRVLDIGAGYGAVAATVLDRFPNATAVGLDISEPMMEEGRRRMSRFGNRFSYHVGDFADGSLPADLPGTFDAAVASASIHHLPTEAKQQLYRELFNKLNPGGCFFNVDQVTPVAEDTKEWYRARRQRDQEAGREAPRQQNPHALQTHHHIETAPDQMAMTRAAGFVQVDVFHKQLRQTIIGGFKPKA